MYKTISLEEVENSSTVTTRDHKHVRIDENDRMILKIEPEHVQTLRKTLWLNVWDCEEEAQFAKALVELKW